MPLTGWILLGPSALYYWLVSAIIISVDNETSETPAFVSNQVWNCGQITILWGCSSCSEIVVESQFTKVICINV